MEQDIKLCLKKIFNEVSNRTITDTSKDIREFGMNSLQFITYAAKLEEEFDFEFDFDDIDNINPFSIDNIYNYICQRR